MPTSLKTPNLYMLQTPSPYAHYGNKDSGARVRSAVVSRNGYWLRGGGVASRLQRQVRRLHKHDAKSEGNSSSSVPRRNEKQLSSNCARRASWTPMVPSAT